MGHTRLRIISEQEWYMFEWLDATTLEHPDKPVFVKGPMKLSWPTGMTDGEKPHLVRNCRGDMVPAHMEDGDLQVDRGVQIG